MKYLKTFENEKYFGIKKDDIVYFIDPDHEYDNKYIVYKVLGLSKGLNYLMEEK